MIEKVDFDKLDDKVSKLDSRVSKLENTQAIIKTNIDLIDPKSFIAFQTTTIEALRIIQNDFIEAKKEQNRRTNITISIVGLILVAIQILLHVLKLGA